VTRLKLSRSLARVAPSPRCTARRIAAVVVPFAAVTSAACRGPGDDAIAAAPPVAAAAFDESRWQPPAESDIPADSLGASISRGLALLRFTPESLPRFATSALRCTSCHQDDGRKATAAPLTGAHARYPKYMSRTGAVIGLADRVNYCFTRSLAGVALPVESREMQDLLAYLAYLSRGIPVGASTAGANGLVRMPEILIGDTARGRALFQQQECIVCHGAEGKGAGPIPALWGERSYSLGASMAREERAASFIYHNMPQTRPGTLSAQQAFDLAAFINAQPRPDSPGKEDDWPVGGAPADVPYRTAGHEPYRPPGRILPRRNPRGAIVPPPAPVKGRVTG
jgi:thiosulfate dehydrogenase